MAVLSWDNNNVLHLSINIFQTKLSGWVNFLIIESQDLSTMIPLEKIHKHDIGTIQLWIGGFQCFNGKLCVLALNHRVG